ncbi:MAG: hypothetical protein NTY48_06695 [Candidatus Diapherotrites archaeon]|nr:hypothetical protein [Candidatus Diapherotrites archaeon]
MGLFEQLQNLMIKYHFRPEKKLSQFFCINEALLIFLANKAGIEKGDVILEIGPGTGFLTRVLLNKAKKCGAKIVAVEPADDMVELLEEEFKDEIKLGNLKLICNNVLEEDLEKLGINKIVSLPPYHISSDLVSKITLTKGIKKAILVLDRGFVEKLLAFEGLSEYVALTVLLNLNAKIEVLEGSIAQQSFFPVPNCQSAAILMDFDMKNNSKEFFTFLRELFRHKNKDLSRGLRQAFIFLSAQLGWKEKDFEKKLKTVSYQDKKVYSLSPKEFLEVFEHFNSVVKATTKKVKAKF